MALEAAPGRPGRVWICCRQQGSIISHQLDTRQGSQPESRLHVAPALAVQTGSDGCTTVTQAARTKRSVKEPPESRCSAWRGVDMMGWLDVRLLSETPRLPFFDIFFKVARGLAVLRSRGGRWCEAGARGTKRKEGPHQAGLRWLDRSRPFAKKRRAGG